MDFERLRVFQAVARRGSFTAAAAQLYRTQPAISQSIKALEREMGEQLLLRTGRRAILTEAGRILLDHLKEAFAVLERGKAKLEAMGELKTGELSICASDTTTCYVLPPVLRAFRDRYPGVELKIVNRPSPLAARLVAERAVHLGIVTLPIRRKDVVTEELLLREDVLICARHHPLRKRKRASLSSLSDFSFLLLDKGSNTRAFIDRRFSSAGVRPTIVMELGSIDAIKMLVALDFGISIVPRVSVAREADEGTLHTVKVFAKKEVRRLGLVYPQHGLTSLAAQVFSSMLKDECRKLGAV